jgi:hypothetical protein
MAADQNMQRFPEDGSRMSWRNVTFKCAFIYLDNTALRIDMGGVDL